jgi:uncharacterized protein involved in outer membrane biogenesis
MKKILIRSLIALVVLLLLAALCVRLFLDGAIKRGVETFGPKLTKVDIKLDSVGVSLLTGSGKIKGLVVGNPEGFKTPFCIKVGSASLALQPSSLLSDKIIINSINVQGPEITYETDLRNSNLGKLLANVQAATGGGAKPAAAPAEPSKETKPAKKLEVDEFIISGGKVSVSLTTLGGKSVTVPLPDIHLTDLGKGTDGITAADLTEKVLAAIEKATAQVASGAATDLAKGVTSLGTNATQAVSGAASSITKGIGGLFQKK